MYLLYEGVICWGQNTQTLIIQHKPGAIVCQKQSPAAKNKSHSISCLN